MRFSDLKFQPKFMGFPGIQAVVHFSNGYGASVVKGPHTYGGLEGFYELAVLHDGELCYDSGLTEDVFGWLTPSEVSDLLEKIEALPPK